MTKTVRTKLFAVIGIVLGGVCIDQFIKIWVKTHMKLHESISVTSWFRITFIENDGMAFGMEFFDKFLLTGFRIIASALLICYIVKLIRRNVSWGYLVCIAFVLTGALGNIFDCLFYGLIFNNPNPPYVANFVPFGEGYSTLFYGRVVDMFSFPLFEFNWPEWMPFVGGQHFLFFSYIFNFADACISCSVIALLLFYSKTLSVELNDNKSNDA